MGCLVIILNQFRHFFNEQFIEWIGANGNVTHLSNLYILFFKLLTKMNYSSSYSFTQFFSKKLISQKLRIKGQFVI